MPAANIASLLLLLLLAACAAPRQGAGVMSVTDIEPEAEVVEVDTGALVLNGNGHYEVEADTSAVDASTAPITEQEISEIEGQEPEIFITTAPPTPPAPRNLGGNGKLTITRYDNREKINVTYRNKKGEYDAGALKKIDRIMRCSQGNEETATALLLVELLDAVEDKFGKRGILLLSGYRTERYNSTLKGAAEHSMHVLGWAADIRIPGYGSAKIKTYARKKGIGGVGYYPYSGFVHLDVGKVRYWSQVRPRKRRRYKKKPAVKASARPGKVAQAGKSGAKAAKKK